MNLADNQIILHDGRRLGHAEYGDPQGEPMLCFHGFPSSRLEAGYSLVHRLKTKAESGSTFQSRDEPERGVRMHLLKRR